MDLGIEVEPGPAVYESQSRRAIRYVYSTTVDISRLVYLAVPI